MHVVVFYDAGEQASYLAMSNWTCVREGRLRVFGYAAVDLADATLQAAALEPAPDSREVVPLDWANAVPVVLVRTRVLQSGPNRHFELEANAYHIGERIFEALRGPAIFADLNGGVRPTPPFTPSLPTGDRFILWVPFGESRVYRGLQRIATEPPVPLTGIHYETGTSVPAAGGVDQPAQTSH